MAVTTDIVDIRGHHLEKIAASLKSGKPHRLVDLLRENPEMQVKVTSTYDHFCRNVCGGSCNDHEFGLDQWDKAFIFLYGLREDVEMSSSKFLEKVKEVADKRKHFALSDPVMGNVEMGYSQIVDYLRDGYF